MNDMTVKELIVALYRFDQDMEVKCSDYDGFCHSEIDDLYVKKAPRGSTGEDYIVITVGRN